MNFRDLGRRMVRVLQLFIVLRCGEALFATFAGELTAFAMEKLSNPDSYAALALGDFRGAWVVSRTYYLSFGYLYVSAMAFLFAALYFDLNSKRTLIATNLGAFLLHSLVVIGFIFSWNIGTYLWIEWIEVALFNWAMAAWLSRWRLASASNSSIWS